MMRRADIAQGWMYAFRISESGYVKIGFSSDLPTRIAEHRRSMGGELIGYSAKCARSQEPIIHASLERQRVAGKREIYHERGEAVSFIRKLTVPIPNPISLPTTAVGWTHTTLRLSEDDLRCVKTEAARLGTTLQALLARGLKLALAEAKEQSA